jgi:hypothetical protein
MFGFMKQMFVYLSYNIATQYNNSQENGKNSFKKRNN